MKRKIVISIVCALLVCVLLATLTSCMKIGMKESNIKSRLEEGGATCQYARTTPMTKDSSGCVFEDIIHATKSYTVSVDGQDAETVQEVYVIFCGNDSTADWTENACKKYITDNKQDSDKWQTYRYERVVVCGYFKLVSLARNY